MANKDAARGFRAIRHLSGGEIRTVEKVVTTGEVIYRGDLVTMQDAGTIISSTTNDGITVIGVAAQYVDDSASAGGKKILIYEDPNIVYAVQCDSGTAPTAADIGETANHDDETGSSVTKNSIHELDASDIGTGLQLRIEGIYPVVDNAWGEHVVVEVVLNEHVHRAGTASI
jgi:hypothetical protein